MLSSILTKLEHYLHWVPVHFKSISESDWSDKPRLDKWSKKEIFGHLIDSATYNLQRFSRIPLDPSPYVIQTYPQSELVKMHAYQKQNIDHLIQLWKTLNHQIFWLWQNYSPTQLELSILAPGDDQQQTLDWLIKDYLLHLEHHLRQIVGDLDQLKSTPKWQTGLTEAIEKLKEKNDQRFVSLLKHGSMSIEYYAPKVIDPQQPHRQDELYIIASGQGTFYNNGHRQACKAGDVLFVPAGLEHRFENFSDDFATWVVFYGPDGGEKAYPPFFEQSKNIDGTTYTISTDPQRLDLDAIVHFISRSYWGNKREKKTIEKALFGALNFGVYKNQQQIGLARVITDYATFVYIGDVYILEPFRKKGLSKWLMSCITSFAPIQKVNSWLLHTKDAHGLYEQYGFKRTDKAEMIMERQLNAAASTEKKISTKVKD